MLLLSFHRKGRRVRAGFSQVEIILAVVLLAMAALGLSRAMLGSRTLAEANSQRALATEGARRILEEMADADFDEVLALYDASPANDPQGAGTASGASFAIDGLAPLGEDADGQVGEIVLPLVNGQLREDAALHDLGLPRDLDGDGSIDALDHTLGYQLLPVLVRVRWGSDATPMQVEIRTILAER